MTKFEDGMYAYISGTVSDVRHVKNGMMMTVETKREGAQYPDRVTVWGVTGMYGKGDRVKVKGWLSWQRREADDGKTYFNVSINKPEITDVEKALTAEKVAHDIVTAELSDAPF